MISVKILLALQHTDYIGRGLYNFHLAVFKALKLQPFSTIYHIQFVCNKDNGCAAGSMLDRLTESLFSCTAERSEVTSQVQPAALVLVRILWGFVRWLVTGQSWRLHQTSVNQILLAQLPVNQAHSSHRLKSWTDHCVEPKLMEVNEKRTEPNSDDQLQIIITVSWSDVLTSEFITDAKVKKHY